MIPTRLRSATLCIATATIASVTTGVVQERQTPAAPASEEQASVALTYLEIVTPEMEDTCELLEALHGVEFGEPQMALGNARTATLANDGRIAVRAPMHAGEKPVVRPYVMVEDLDAAFRAVEESGAQVMMPPTKSLDGGRFCLFTHGGIEHGLWEK